MPLSLLMLKQNAQVRVCHSKVPLEEMIDTIKWADVVVSACGKPFMVKPDWLKQEAMVIDVGISKHTETTDEGTETMIQGDVEFSEETLERVSKITPVPGGVGPMTITMLLNNLTLGWMRTNFDLMINEQSYRSL